MCQSRLRVVPCDVGSSSRRDIVHVPCRADVARQMRRAPPHLSTGPLPTVSPPRSLTLPLTLPHACLESAYYQRTPPVAPHHARPLAARHLLSTAAGLRRRSRSPPAVPPLQKRRHRRESANPMQRSAEADCRRFRLCSARKKNGYAAFCSSPCHICARTVPHLPGTKRMARMDVCHRRRWGFRVHRQYRGRSERPAVAAGLSRIPLTDRRLAAGPRRAVTAVMCTSSGWFKVADC